MENTMGKGLYWLVAGALLVLTGCTESPYSPEQQQLLAQYEQGKDKRGQVFFVQVCSGCHKGNYQMEVPPKDYTMASWHQLLEQDKHSLNGKSHNLSDYFSLAYREQLAQNNQVMVLMLGLSAEQIRLDLGNYLLNGAKDSDNPQSCN